MRYYYLEPTKVTIKGEITEKDPFAIVLTQQKTNWSIYISESGENHSRS